MERQPNKRGRPRIHKDKQAAQAAASAAYRARRRVRRQAPTMHSEIIDLSAVPTWKIK
ncbi:MAG: hypothetical protein M0Z50_12845 [Planctomycetia bacterium]|nr:hypothetical protein [Planctomycetia bacterium]